MGWWVGDKLMGWSVGSGWMGGWVGGCVCSAGLQYAVFTTILFLPLFVEELNPCRTDLERLIWRNHYHLMLTLITS